MDHEKFILYPKKAKGDDGHRTFSIRIKDDLAEKLDDIAAQTGYSRNELIGKLLEYAIERCVVAEK